MAVLIFYALISGLFSLVGGLLLLWKPNLTNRFITPLISFGAGAFLGAVFLDILPEALESTVETHPILLATLTGFLAFFILERLIMKNVKHHTKDQPHSDHTESLPALIILGDSFHNFLDGIVIALAFVANPLLGLPAALAISAHEIPQEIGDFAILLKLNWKKSSIIAVNVFQSLLTIPGVLVGYYAGNVFEPYLPYFLGGTAGIFLYIAASDLIPELHHHSEHKHFFRIILPLLSAIIIIYYATSLAEH